MNIHLRIKQRTKTKLVATLNPAFRFMCGFLALLLGGAVATSENFAVIPGLLCAFSLCSLFYYEVWVCDKQTQSIQYRMGILVPFKRLAISVSDLAEIGHITITRKRGMSTQKLHRTVLLTKDGRLVTIEIIPQRREGVAHRFAAFLNIHYNDAIET